MRNVQKDILCIRARGLCVLQDEASKTRYWEEIWLLWKWAQETARRETYQKWDWTFQNHLLQLENVSDGGEWDRKFTYDVGMRMKVIEVLLELVGFESRDQNLLDTHLPSKNLNWAGTLSPKRKLAKSRKTFPNSLKTYPPNRDVGCTQKIWINFLWASVSSINVWCKFTGSVCGPYTDTVRWIFQRRTVYI